MTGRGKAALDDIGELVRRLVGGDALPEPADEPGVQTNGADTVGRALAVAGQACAQHERAAGVVGRGGAPVEDLVNRCRDYSLRGHSFQVSIPFCRCQPSAQL
jgi:hypothetical protein